MTKSFAALKQYLPVLGMVLAAVLQTFMVAATDGKLSLTDFLTVAIAFLGALTTYVVPRLERFPWLKPVVAALTAALVFLVSALVDDHISVDEWMNTVVQLIAGLGIVAVGNKHVPVTPDVAPTEAEYTGPGA